MVIFSVLTKLHITGTPPPEQCPLNIPYAFYDGTKCCTDDKDRQGNELRLTSMTCIGAEVGCPKERCISNGEILECLLTNASIEHTKRILK